MRQWLLNLASTEFPLGAICTLIGTVLGFVLFVLWDRWKARKEAARRKSRMVALIRDDMVSNARTIAHDLKLLGTEAGFLEAGKNLLDPLPPLKANFWDVVKADLTGDLLEHKALLNCLRDVAWRADLVNELIRSRESFRIANAANTQLNYRLGLYDKQLVEQLGKLAIPIGECEELLKKWA